MLEIYDYRIIQEPQNVDNYVQRGVAKFKLGDYEGAIKDYNIAIKLDPESGIYYGLRANAKIELKMYNEAIKDLNKTKELAPDLAKITDKKLEMIKNMQDLNKVIQKYL